MAEEPPLTSESVYGLAVVDEDRGFLGLTKDAIEKLGTCSKLYVIMSTGVARRGKSTRLTQLINPNFEPPTDDANIFKTANGPDPVTGMKRDNMSFPTFGPLKLSIFCRQWGFDIRPGDDSIGLVFVDSQGTKAITDSGRGLRSAFTALSTTLGLRICEGSAAQTDNFNEITGGLKINAIVNRGRRDSCSYALAVISRDTYQPKFSERGEAHEQRKHEDNDRYAELWRNQFPLLRNTEDFRVYFLDNPIVYNDGYWKSMKEIAGWIADLARTKHRSFRSIQAIVEQSAGILQKFRSEHPDIADDADIPADLLAQNWLLSELNDKMGEVLSFAQDEIDRLIGVDSIPDCEVLEIDLSRMIDQMILKSTRKLDEIGNEMWGNYRDDIGEAMIHLEECLQRQITSIVEFSVNTRQQNVVNRVRRSICESAEHVVDDVIREASEELEKKSMSEVLDVNFDQSFILKWAEEGYVRFMKEVPNLCMSAAIQSHPMIDEVIRAKCDHLKSQLRDAIQGQLIVKMDAAHQLKLTDTRDKAAQERIAQEAAYEAEKKKLEDKHNRELAEITMKMDQDRYEALEQAEKLREHIKHMTEIQERTKAEFKKNQEQFEKDLAKRDANAAAIREQEHAAWAKKLEEQARADDAKRQALEREIKELRKGQLLTSSPSPVPVPVAAEPSAGNDIKPGSRVHLDGPYYVDSYGSGKGYRVVQGAAYVDRLISCRKAGYHCRNSDGDIGWAPRSSIRPL